MTSSRHLPQRIYPVVDSASWIDRLGKAGARFIQLRIKDKAGPELLEEIREGLKAANAHDITLVINDFWREALECGATHVHLGQEDLDTADMKALRAAGIGVGISTHDVPELERALSFAPWYVALGPIWPTTTKEMAFGPQGTQRLTEWRERIGPDMPLVAIGGITLEHAPACLAAGADSVSAISDFIRHADPEGQVRKWLAATYS